MKPALTEPQRRVLEMVAEGTTFLPSFAILNAIKELKSAGVVELVGADTHSESYRITAKGRAALGGEDGSG